MSASQFLPKSKEEKKRSTEQTKEKESKEEKEWGIHISLLYRQMPFLENGPFYGEKKTSN